MDFYSFAEGLSPWSIGLFFVVWIVLLLLIKRVVFGLLRRAIKGSDLYNIFVHSVDMPLNLLIITGGGAVVGKMLSASDTVMPVYIMTGFKLITIIAVALFFDKFFIFSE